MRRIIFLVVLVSLFVPAIGLFALSDEVAQVTNIDKVTDPKKPKEAPVTIIRNSKAISEADIDFGFAIQNFDQIRTGSKSTIEIQTNPKTGIAATIIIKPNSILTVDITSLKSTQTGSLDLLSGAVALKVQKMTGTNKLDVRTGSAVMGVRGTQFEVNISFSGDVLLSTSEGRVECTTDNDKTLFSAPGSVIQGTLEGEWSAIPVAVDKLSDFRAKWNTGRIDAFRADPARATSQFAKRYVDLKDKFNTAFAEMMANHDLIQKWIQEDLAGNIGDAKQVIVEKKKVLASLVKLHKVNVLFERVYLRLVQLDELYAQGIAPTGTIKGTNMTVAAFYQKFRAERADLNQKFLDTQYITKLFAKRNGGDFPLDLATSAELSTDKDFFGSDSNGTSSDGFFN